jgi:uracil permease
MAQLPRTLCGDGLATSLAGLLNAPSNTSYGENCGVIALTGIKDPSVVRIAAVIMIVLGFSPWFSQLVLSIPTAAIGAVSFLMYGMISASGLKNLVENKVDFSDTRTLVIIAMILVSGLGFSTYPLVFNLGAHVISVSGIAIATLVGILLNAIWKKKA